MRRSRFFFFFSFQDRFVLTTELQQYVAGNTQRVAKLICQKADFEVFSNIENTAVVFYVHTERGRTLKEECIDCS